VDDHDSGRTVKKVAEPPTPRMSHAHKISRKGKERELAHEEEELKSRPSSRAQSLKDEGLGSVPPGEDETDWDDTDGEREFVGAGLGGGSGFRSALDTATSTPLSHPADPRGDHSYWSTFRQNSGMSASASGSTSVARSPKAASSMRESTTGVSGLSTPIHRPTILTTSPSGGAVSGTEDISTPVPTTGKSGGAMRHARRLKSKIMPHRTPTGTSARAAEPEMSAPVVTNEMLAGALPVMILKTWLDRDEYGHRAVPVLLGNLRFRIGDSVGLRGGGNRSHSGREMIKIECEYGDGAIKWILYRELRDFLLLHAHYKAANVGTRVTGLRSSRRVELPEFPRNSLPYWARDKADKGGDRTDEERPPRDGRLQASTQSEKHIGPASRAALQQYLIDLIRAVLFRPESNRLCIFFELSALTVALAPRGGFQGKAGFLKILSMKAGRRSAHPGLLPSTWRQHREPKWFMVRESYFVSTDGPQETDVYDVFLIDSDFAIERPRRAYRKGLHLLSGHKHKGGKNDHPAELELLDEEDNKDTSHHTFYISNAQRRIKLVAKNARQMHQFIVSMERVAFQCVWTGRNRFDSFAPVRMNVAAQWLVDGRDYFWNLSRAINMARSRIYIHDWWISPEIYLRRPGDERYRLDNLLKRKAEEGVRIFIIIYNEVSAKTTPVESLYAKRSLVGLHPNIMVQRSPSHLPSGALYWSHHEKLCVIDEAIGFMGGLDLCFGRWDTSQHILTDEDHTQPDGPDGPVWIGKDYWNERVAEFHDLDKPLDDAFDRAKTPRMPWHDTGLQIVGQPARDLCRHFCQRWNYLLRIKNHTRKMPFLLPPPDFTESELVDLKLQGTCEVQICRSVGPWSMGTTTKIEHSIQNAYVKSIQLSEHFVYIENQFFITSTVVDTTTIENRIGDALVQRIIRAHKEGQKWRACIVIPLLPGYTHPIDTAEASSVRIILECQNRTICRGTHSIFSRLRKEGINPDDYINFFSLRGWAKFKSGALTTEQVYIHGKTMIVDDRLVLCGSANINERSQRGDRDSELVAVVRDTDMIDGTMAGKPFKVGRYAHTLRMRLMREHVGVDVDAIEEDELMMRSPLAATSEIAVWDPDNEQTEGAKRGITRVEESTARERLNATLASAVGSVAKGIGENVKREAREIKDRIHSPVGMQDPTAGVTGPERKDMGPDGCVVAGFASSVVPTLEEKTMAQRHPDAQHPNGAPLFGLDGAMSTSEVSVPLDPDGKGKSDGAELQAGRPGMGELRPQPDTDKLGAPAPTEAHPLRPDEHEEASDVRKILRKHISPKVGSSAWNLPIPTPKIDPNRFHDPLDDRFWNGMWVAVAVHNTQIFRKVFRCVPDDLVTSWAQYKAFANHMDKFARTEDTAAAKNDVKVTHDAGGTGGGVVGPAGSDSRKPQTADAPGAGGHVHSSTEDNCQRTGNNSAGHGSTNAGGTGNGSADQAKTHTERLTSISTVGGASTDRTPSGDNQAWAQWELDEMEELLNEVRGHLVLYSTRFLEAEDLANNFLFNVSTTNPCAVPQCHTELELTPIAARTHSPSRHL
jgi:phospholipase D1/2